jgi:hypothetical protein
MGNPMRNRANAKRATGLRGLILKKDTGFFLEKARLNQALWRPVIVHGLHDRCCRRVSDHHWDE